MIKKITFLVVACFCINQMNAQQLLSPSSNFSTKKTSYVTLADGTEIKGNAKVKYKKQQIQSIKINDGVKNNKIKAKDINYMYLPQSAADKLARAADFLKDAQKWNDEKLNNDLLGKGYIYFESTKVKIKKKEYTMVMQLLNPTFSGAVKVYHDPKAKESMSVGVAGVTVAGGNAKSYYVKKDDEAVAYLLTKKGYKKEFPLFWKGCDAVINTYPSVVWTDMPKHIVTYTESCATK